MYKIILTISLTVIATLSHATLTNDDWIKQIQLRMDLSNPSGNQGVCVVYPETTALPYVYKNRNHPKLVIAKQHHLLNETISIVKLYRPEQNVLEFEYDVTDIGKQYLKTWPNVSYFGFCYGKLVVDSIVKIEGLQITYQYKIENTPEWAKLIQFNFKNPVNDQQQETALFAYNEDDELISLSSNYSYYIEIK